jgi:hypothetical protein
VSDRSATTKDSATRQERLTLLPHELAFLLQVSRKRVKAMIASGEIPDASRDAWRRVAFEDALELIRRLTAEGQCSPLAELLLERLREGRLRVSREEARWHSLEAALARSGSPRG